MTAIVKQEPQALAIEESTARALEAQERAHVAVRYQMAIQRPRDFDRTRLSLLTDCRRPLFAQAARYAKPQGREKVEGWSIRFVEAAIRRMGNIDTRVRVTMDDPIRRVVSIEVTDLEANVTYPTEIVISKEVERRSAEGREVLRERKNKQGQTVFIVVATDDEIAVKQASAVSKALRTNGLRLIPTDILEEALEVIRDTVTTQDKKDPDAARKRLFDSFAQLGVGPEAIKKYLDRDVTPQDFDMLRKIYQAIKSGETTWKEVSADEEQQTPAAKIADRARKARKEDEAAPEPQKEQG